MRLATPCLLALALLTAATGVAAATGNTPPLASAGLDQTVPPDATVYLDANGSSDPDGEITRYEWTVETPAGGSIRPDCATCRQTSFDVDTTGQYAVTLTVTDDDGATSSDTLYVTAEPEAGPTVSLSGPGATSPDNENVFTARLSGDNASLQTLAWVVDGDVLEQESVSGSDATRSLTRSFDTTGDVSVTALAYDTLGRRGTATQTVTVQATGGALGTGNGCNNGNAWEGLCTGGGDALISTPDGTQYILDSNGAEGVQLTADDGEGLRTYEDPTSSERISRRSPGSDLYVVDDGVSVGDALDQTTTSQKKSAESESNSNENQDSGINKIGNSNGNQFSDIGVDSVSETDKTVLGNIGVTVPQRPSTSSSDDDDDSSDSDSDATDNDGDSTGGDETDDSDSDTDNTGSSGGSKSGTKSSSDGGDSSGKKGGSKGSSGGFVGL